MFYLHIFPSLGLVFRWSNLGQMPLLAAGGGRTCGAAKPGHPTAPWERSWDPAVGGRLTAGWGCLKGFKRLKPKMAVRISLMICDDLKIDDLKIWICKEKDTEFLNPLHLKKEPLGWRRALRALHYNCTRMKKHKHNFRPEPFWTCFTVKNWLVVLVSLVCFSQIVYFPWMISKFDPTRFFSSGYHKPPEKIVLFAKTPLYFQQASLVAEPGVLCQFRLPGDIEQ